MMLKPQLPCAGQPGRKKAMGQPTPGQSTRQELSFTTTKETSYPNAEVAIVKGANS